MPFERGVDHGLLRVPSESSAAPNDSCILVQENIHVAGVFDQSHRFGDNGIQYIGQVQAGCEMDAQLLEGIQLVGLLFEQGKKRLVVDQLVAEGLRAVNIVRQMFFDGKCKNVKKFDQRVSVNFRNILFFQNAPCLGEDL
jgi:hypothetical protein